MATVVAPVNASLSAISSVAATDVASSPNEVTASVAVAASNPMPEISSEPAGGIAPSVVNSTVSE